jgi:hypothetical protein
VKKLALFLAAVSLAFNCSGSPEPVIAAERRSPLVERVPAPEEIEVPDEWQVGSAGLSREITQLLGDLDQRKGKGLGDMYEARQLSQLYRAPGPRETNAYFYLQRMFMGDTGCIYVFLEDLATGVLSPEWVRLCSQRAYYDPPIPRFVDLDLDGVEELVTTHFFHNGTATNAYVDTYWSVAPDLSMSSVFSLLREDMGVRIEPGSWGTATRTLWRIGGMPPAESLCAAVTWSPQKAGTPTEILGLVFLQQDLATGQWSEAGVRHDLPSPWDLQVTTKHRY